MRRLLRTVIVMAIVLEALLVWTWNDVRTSSTEEGGDKVGPGARMAALAIASIFPLALVLMPWLFRLDGFSAGSIAVAAALEVALFWGWANSPQQEDLWLFLATSGFMAVLVATTLWFYQLQHEK